MKTKTLKQFGNITLTSNILVTDPCYSKTDSYCNTIIIKPGTYKTFVEYDDESSRPASCIVIHEQYEDNNSWEEDKNISVGVDSGQAGVFCDSIYPEEEDEVGEYGDLETFYGQCCETTCGEQYDKFTEWHRTKHEVERYEEFYKGKREWWDYAYHKEQYENYTINFDKYIKDYEEKCMTSVHGSGDTLIKQVKDLVKREISERDEHIKYYKMKLDLYDYYLQHGNLGEEPIWEQAGTVFKKGFNVRSGYGDGVYPCYTQKNDDGDIVAIKIEFI